VTRCAKCRNMAELGLTVAAPPAHWSDEYIGPDAAADDAVHANREAKGEEVKTLALTARAREGATCPEE